MRYNAPEMSVLSAVQGYTPLHGYGAARNDGWIYSAALPEAIGLRYLRKSP